MFYHFKGTVTAQDYTKILTVMSKRLMLVFSGAMLLFTGINVAINRQQWAVSVFMGLIVLVVGNLFLRWQLKSRFLKNFKPQTIDMYVTEEQINAQMNVRNVEIFSDRVHFFEGRNQVMIFKKEMLQDVTQWEAFVTMAKNLPLKTKK
ncbi:hypothetical protein [Lactococcus kimchii]|uniref:hypothetical protein n=1 Tax=Lactococcus sp. S-13 TaxID=2507158 RepID=UPI0010233309|nr:hypothetical protein [Lactococcus sp. S-13]RZI48708.1 hypothetical protein EQJ87_04155 [Lactococcus sp. S-13]